MPDPFASLAVRYRAFAEDARGRSPLYEDLANAVAGDPFILAFLAQLPEPKQQPNLLLGAVKYGWGAQPDWKSFRGVVEANQEAIRQIILARRTQTNEPGRCATLLPVLALLPQPLALIEIGAAAGLCLLPDRYGYVYNGSIGIPAAVDSGVAPPVFECQATVKTPIPHKNLQIAWRAGLDLEPVDVRDPDSVRWLEALVWPDEGEHLQLLRQSIDVARRDPPAIHRGDLRTDLTALAAQAPHDAMLVVFHSAVLMYVPSMQERAALGRAIDALGATWISNEPPAASPADQGSSTPSGSSGENLLAVHRQPVAWADSHGSWIRWFAHNRQAS